MRKTQSLRLAAILAFSILSESCKNEQLDVEALQAGKTSQAALTTQTPISFVVTCRLDNCKQDGVAIEAPGYTFGEQTLFVVTHRRGTTNFNKALGVMRGATAWYIFTQDGSDIPLGTTFNVMAADYTVGASTVGTGLGGSGKGGLSVVSAG